MADRSTYNDASSPMPTGLQFLNQYSTRIGQLFDASVLPLAAIGGTADVVTATLDPPLVSGLKEGMKFTLTWANANTGPMTLSVNGGVAVPVLDANGAAMVASGTTAGQRSILEYTGAAFRVLGGGGSGGGGGAARYFWQFTASGTWTKPSGLDDNTMVYAVVFGAGGGWRT